MMSPMQTAQGPRGRSAPASAWHRLRLEDPDYPAQPHDLSSEGTAR